MDAAIYLNFDRICRTCMHMIAEDEIFAATTAERSEVECHSIFDTVEECGTMRIFELLATTTAQLHVKLSDELPQKICRECFHLLMSVYRFQQMCMQSEQQMREILAKRCPDVKFTMPTLLIDSEADRNEISMVADLEGEMEANAVNDSLEVPLANDPLYNAQHLKKEEFIDEKECSGENISHEASTAGTNLIDSNLIFEIGTPKTAHEYVAVSIGVSRKECIDSDRNPDMNKQKEQINEKVSTFSCNLCSKSFSQYRFLKRHLKRHEKWEKKKNLPKEEDRRYHLKCDTCNRRFTKPESLLNHKQVHTDGAKAAEKKKIYACDSCDNFYCSKRTLVYHKKRVHSADPIAVPKRHTCEICNKGFRFTQGLVDHLRTHTGETPFLCSLCGKSFKSLNNLEQHSLRHSGVRRFECPDCPQKFKCSTDLSKHRTIHRPIKPHVCDICGTAFPKSNQLKLHKMYHMGTKPYKCEYCDMRFVRMDNQRRHMRTHTGEKPYKCKFCERAFAQTNDLVKHLRNHLGDNVYTCELCPSAFRLATELRLHFASHRNDDEETRARNMMALKEVDASLRLRIRGNGGLNIINGC